MGADVDQTATLIAVASRIAAGTPGFQEVRGPGAGDQSTQAFMRQLRAEVLDSLGQDFTEKKICGDNAFAVDFYFPDEATIVEVALGLPNPNTEFEKDVLKALMAQRRVTSSGASSSSPERERRRSAINPAGEPSGGGRRSTTTSASKSMISRVNRAVGCGHATSLFGREYRPRVR